MSLCTSGSTTLTAGRQRIGWGTARFWSPMDMFNPISPLQIESEERQGVDAALAAFRSAGGLRWNAGVRASGRLPPLHLSRAPQPDDSQL